jgi:hypothetical protein
LIIGHVGISELIWGPGDKPSKGSVKVKEPDAEFASIDKTLKVKSIEEIESE